jgi:hypothetical protein
VAWPTGWPGRPAQLEDRAWRDACYIADVGASNPKGVAHTLTRLDEAGLPQDHPARGHRWPPGFLDGHGLGPELDDLREVRPTPSASA